MASKNTASIALFLALNLVLFNLAFASYVARPLKSCPPDTLKLNVCADVLDLVHLRVGSPKKAACCSLVGNLIKLDAAACLCTAVHANVLGLVNLNLNVDLTALVNYCDCKLPSDFLCPPRHA
ncbi:putative lipid-binding protein AIR1 [Chenopodium quinoa]|uniref:Bifunctional inhibitor/plant lipid transfer protein/seed storage helical domain-containing protein n=1 Tax=Chenopodium quinoa TaxID=63459 RepID=A0A803LHW8_CHEQI|nr:putative lipid-binding protein AIR1 [Chenopodium quinoa]